MNYTYNAHLLLEERVEEVGIDIHQKYPFIDLTTAKKIAKMEGAISEKINFHIIFTRYYNILTILKPNTYEFNKVMKDFINICKNAPLDEEKYTILTNIIKFSNGEGNFPL